MDGQAQLPTSPSLSLWVNLGLKEGGQRPRKRMSAKPPQSAGSPIFAALEDRRALLLGYVKNDVVTLDRLALLWTIEAACGGSLSRAPETHPVLLHLL